MGGSSMARIKQSREGKPKDTEALKPPTFFFKAAKAGKRPVSSTNKSRQTGGGETGTKTQRQLKLPEVPEIST